MEWDKIALALSAAIFVTIYPGATVVVQKSDDGRIRFLPVTHLPEGTGAHRVVHLTHPEHSFEIQVLSNDSPPSVTKLIFGPRA